MRNTVHQLLTAQAGLVAVVPSDRWYQAGAVVDVPPRPFVVLRWLAPVGGNASGRFMRQLRLEIHDERGSYARCQAFLGGPDKNNGVYAVLSPLLNYVGVDGRITQADYLGHSGDQEDQTYNTNMQFSSWRMIGVEL